jgi:hypothetical protein
MLRREIGEDDISPSFNWSGDNRAIRRILASKVLERSGMREIGSPRFGNQVGILVDQQSRILGIYHENRVTGC